MIEKLGHFDGPKKRLHNWIRQTFKDKENFQRDYVAPKETKRSPVRVYEEAKAIVDNLCIIYPYRDFFPKNGSLDADSKFKTYRDLISGEHKFYIDNKASKLHEQLMFEKEVNAKSITNLSRFIAALKSQSEIDIEKDSLRELMNSTSENSHNFKSNPHELSCWNKLVDLRARTRKNPEDSHLYRKMAEHLYELNIIDQSLNQVNEAITLTPEDGIAWAIKAKTLLERLTPSKKEHFQALAMTDFSGHISSPITSEERWINERVDETAESVEEIRNEFIEAAFNALEHWPHWEEVPLSWGQKNYHPNTTISGDCSLKIERGWLFFHLIMNLRPVDLFTIDNGKSRLLDIYNTWRTPSCTNAFPSIYLDFFSKERSFENDFRIRLTAYMAQISEETHKALLDQFIDMFKSYDFSANESLETLSRSLISNHFWEYLGPVDYTNLYSLLMLYKRQNDEHEKLSSFSRKIAAELQSVFKSSIKLYSQHFNNVIKYSEEATIPIKEKEIEKEFSTALMRAGDVIESMASMIDRKAIYKLSDPRKLHQGYGDLMLYLPLVEYNLTANREAKDIITFFTESPVYMEYCIMSEDDYLLSLFEKYWEHERANPKAEKPIDFFSKAQEIVQQRYWDEFEID
jgi:hypothetical protein